MIGQTVSHYRILEKLGEGGMGEVFLAEDASLRRNVALKFLPEHLQQDTLAHKRFLREAESAAALDHPYICHINEVAKTETGQDIIVMEYVEGHTLKDKLDEGPLSFQEAIRISAEVADALEVAHQKGIVHRDLKPANIMLTRQGHAKVMDFGLAKRLATDDGTEQDLTSGLTREGSTLGTPAYMSPEQVRAQPVDYRSDIFSFGIILYEMLTGVHPFRRSQPVETMGAILHAEPEPLTEYLPGPSEFLQETVSQLLAKNPDERIHTIEKVANRLTELSSQAEGLRLTPFLRSRLGKRLTFVFTAVIAVSLIGWWALRERTTKVGSPIVSSLAVLPLENLSGDPEQDYFVDGMTEALITDLSRIGALKVIARKSAMRYKDSDKPLSEIADELNVEAVIEGSVFREADQVRINAELIEAATGQNLWADSYQRSLTSILALQGEVAQAIAHEIQVTLTPGEEDLLIHTRQVNPEAYEACLKGLFHVNKRTGPDLETALQYFELALEKDPDYARAHVGIASVWGYLSGMGLVPASESSPKVRAALLQAIELDDKLAEAHYALAQMKAFMDWDWEGAETSFLRAIELDPNFADVRAGYSSFLMIMRRPDEAMVQIARALELDPLSPNLQSAYGARLFRTGRIDDAIEHFHKVLRTDPHHQGALAPLPSAYYLKGMYEEAYKAMKAQAGFRGGQEAVKAMERGYAEAGFKGAMRREAERRAARSDTAYEVPFGVARQFAMAGMNQEALDWLERALEKRDLNVLGIGVEPVFDGLHEEPRFQNILRQLNFPEEVLAGYLNETP